MIDLTAEFLRSIMRYDPDTGAFTRIRNATDGRARIKPITGKPNERGYVRIKINRKLYKRSRLAWLYMTGEWPDGIVDHANRNRADDRWTNLRLATFAQNSFNTKRTTNSGLPRGVWRNRGKWSAKIRVAGESVYLGQYDTPEEAGTAYNVAAKFHHGDFAILNGVEG